MKFKSLLSSQSWKQGFSNENVDKIHIRLGDMYLNVPLIYKLGCMLHLWRIYKYWLFFYQTNPVFSSELPTSKPTTFWFLVLSKSKSYGWKKGEDIWSRVRIFVGGLCDYRVSSFVKTKSLTTWKKISFNAFHANMKLIRISGKYIPLKETWIKQFFI